MKIFKLLKLNTRNKRSKAFTLIELLVVISIISLLSSVVLVGVQTAREKAQVTAYRSYLKQVMNAIELYKNDNGAYPTMAWYGGVKSEIVSGKLSKYIKYQEPGNLISGYPDGPYWDDTGYYSCGQKSTGQVSLVEPYVILIYTNGKYDLGMKKVYDPIFDNPYLGDVYCVSLLNS